jgi:hypothetical protein
VTEIWCDTEQVGGFFFREDLQAKLLILHLRSWRFP